MTTILKRGLAIIAGILVVLMLASLGWREYQQYQVSSSRSIDVTTGIDFLGTVELGGIEQWIAVRGQNRGNPVLIYLHGGPGSPMMPFAHTFQIPWEAHFTVVQWDQRGSGKTYSEHDPAVIEPTMTLNQMVEDARELAQYLGWTYNQDKVVVLGHSWGTMLGMTLVKRYPELFSAFVGTGMVISVMENERVGYERAVQVATERNISEALADLKAIAPYPHPELGTKATRHILRRWQREFGFSLYGRDASELESLMLNAGLASPEYSLPELYDALSNASSRFSRTALEQEIDAFDISLSGYDYQLPVFFFLGRHDWQTPSVVAEDFFQKLQAPLKKLIWLENSAHAAIYEESDAFFNALLNEVHPVVVKSDRGP